MVNQCERPSAVVGVDPATLGYELRAVENPPADPFEDGVEARDARVRAVASAWISDYFGRRDGSDWFEWRQYGHRAPVELLERAFSFEELCRIWSAGSVMGPLSEHVENRHPYLEKVRHS